MTIGPVQLLVLAFDRPDFQGGIRAELERLRALLPRAILLLPGYGAQGASARDVRAAFRDVERPWRGALVNSSRGIAFAWREPRHANRSWQEASRFALEAMIGELPEVLGPP